MKKAERAVVLLVALAMASSACGTGSGSRFDVGLQKVALDLAFKSEGGAIPAPKAAEVSPEEALEPLPVESQAKLTIAYPHLAQGDTRTPLRLPNLFRVDCPAA